MSEQSGYSEGKTIEQVGREWHRGLLNGLADGEVNGESGYGVSRSVLATVTLAGGGPGFKATFEFDESANAEYLFEEIPIGGWTEYFEWGGRSRQELSQDEAEGLWLALNTSPE